MSRALPWWAIAVAAAMIGLGALFVVSRPPDAGIHIAVVDGLGRVREAEETLGRALLQARAGELETYDPIVVAVDNVDRVVAATETALAAAGMGPRALAAYDALSVDRRTLVERFKSADALFRNSLVYVPTLAREMARDAREAGRGDLARQLENWVGLLFLALRDRTGPHDLEAAGSALQVALQEGLGARVAVAQLREHGAVLLKSDRKARNALAAVLGFSSGGAVLRLYDSYMQRYRGRQAAARAYGSVLYAVAFFCAAALFFALLRLRRASWRLQESNRLLDAHATDLERTSAALREQIAERRAAEAARERLRHQLHRAQRIESLGTLAGGIAHEVNNALVPVLALSELAMENLPADSLLLGHLEIVRQGGLRARDLVNQLLAFSRSEPSQRAGIDLAATVETSLGLVRATLPANVRLEARLEPVPLVEADAGQLHQVIVNLVTNAVQAIGEQPGSITVSLTASKTTGTAVESSASAWARLGVEDTGRGIAPDILGRVFDPFFTTKPAGEGTGLGLAVVHGIVAAHGGHVEAASRPGCGARFDVNLPIAAPDAGQSTPLARAAA